MEIAARPIGLMNLKIFGSRTAAGLGKTAAEACATGLDRLLTRAAQFGS